MQTLPRVREVPFAAVTKARNFAIHLDSGSMSHNARTAELHIDALANIAAPSSGQKTRPLAPKSPGEFRLAPIGCQLIVAAPDFSLWSLSAKLGRRLVEPPAMSEKKQPCSAISRCASLTLPELEQSKTTVLGSLVSTHSRRSYEHAIDKFLDWYWSEPRLGFNRPVVVQYRSFP